MKTALFANWIQGNMVIADQSLCTGNIWWVDANSTTGGTTSGYGLSPDKPFTTLAAAIAAAGIGDRIYLMSSIAEDSLILATAGVQIIGLGGSVRASGTACADPDGVTWQEATTGTTLLTITAVGCKLKNIKFRIPQTGGTGVALAGAWHTLIEDCLFQGRANSYYALDTDGNNANVVIRRCRFYYNNTATYGTAIYGHGYTVGINSNWLIEYCIFHSNLRHIYSRFKQSVIRNNQLMDIGLKPDGSALTATTMLNLSGDGSNWNIVTGNLFPGDYSNTGGYTAGTNDCWTGNYATDVAEAEVSTAGLTITIPAA
jgi:hypothetical protein